MRYTPAFTVVFLLSVAGLAVNAIIMDRMTNEVNDAHAGPYISPFEKEWRRGRTRPFRPYSAIDERHKQLFPQSRLRTAQSTVNYSLLAIWLAFIAFSMWTDQ